MTQPFTLGVNYWPRRKAMYWWSDFDAGEVREEFAVIKDIGLDLVRVFLLWDDWQPTPDSVSSACLANLQTVADIAADNGLKLDVTFFTGHMSGPNWSPGWLLDGPPLSHVKQLVSGGRVVESGYRNPYTDPTALRAEALLIREVVGALGGHPAVGLWNLGNEPDLFAHPPDAEAGRRWVKNFVDLIHTLDPRPVTCGLHVASLLEDNGLHVDKVYGATDVAVMHAYPMYIPWARGPLDPDFVPYTCALTAALCGKPVLMEEWGGCTAPNGGASQVWEWTAYSEPRTQFMASEDDFAAYVAEVLPRLVAVGATGSMLWCFADYVPELWNKPPCSESRHERFFGFVRPDGTLKPHADVVRKFAATRPTVRDVTIPFPNLPTPDNYYRAPAAYAQQLYQDFRVNVD